MAHPSRAAAAVAQRRHRARRTASAASVLTRPTILTLLLACIALLTFCAVVTPAHAQADAEKAK
ncbi:hypothetical protein OC842_007269, partial [Tilletia horrida]